MRKPRKKRGGGGGRDGDAFCFAAFVGANVGATIFLTPSFTKLLQFFRVFPPHFCHRPCAFFSCRCWGGVRWVVVPCRCAVVRLTLTLRVEEEEEEERGSSFDVLVFVIAAWVFVCSSS